MNAAVELVGRSVAGRVGIVDDRLVGHEQSDDVGQLSWMREIDRVRCAVDNHKDPMVFGLTGNFLDARRTREQRIPAPGNDKRWRNQWVKVFFFGSSAFRCRSS